MNRGFAIYQGEKVYFCDVIVFCNKATYLIAWGGEAIWVKQEDLSQIVFLIAA